MNWREIGHVNQWVAEDGEILDEVHRYNLQVRSTGKHYVGLEEAKRAVELAHAKPPAPTLLMGLPECAANGVPARSKSEYKRRVAQGDQNVLPPSDGSCQTCTGSGVLGSVSSQRFFDCPDCNGTGVEEKRND